jgi:hypothetical protein
VATPPESIAQQGKYRLNGLKVDYSTLSIIKAMDKFYLFIYSFYLHVYLCINIFFVIFVLLKEGIPNICPGSGSSQKFRILADLDLDLQQTVSRNLDVLKFGWLSYIC